MNESLAKMIDVQHFDARIERRINYTQTILAALLVVVIAVPFVFSWWYERNAEVVHKATLSDIAIVGESAVCPGDLLTTRHLFTVSGSGILVADATTWRITPPMTVVFSEARRFIVEDDFSRIVYRSYEIPATIIDERTNQPVPIPPGRYKRILAVSSPSRSSVFSKQSAEFTVLPEEECN